MTEINHLFFEPGHSLMEVDSVHAQIEKTSKKIVIYDPSGWYAVVKQSSKAKKYIVKEMEQEILYSMDKLRGELLKSNLLDNEGNTVKFLKIKHFVYRKSDPKKVFFSYTYHNDFLYFTTKDIEMGNVVLERQYLGPLPISQDKYNDLQFLCNKKVIPSQYRHFYDTLKISNDEEEGIVKPRKKMSVSRKKQPCTSSRADDDEEVVDDPHEAAPEVVTPILPKRPKSLVKKLKFSPL